MDGGWQMRNIYLYLVTFVTLMMIIFGMVSFLNSIARLVFPLEYRYYTTLMDLEAEYTNAGREVPPLEELERVREDRMERDAARDRAFQIRDLVSSLAVWLVALPFYVYHWKKIKIEILDDGGGVGHEA